MPARKLHIDIGPSALRCIPHFDQAVVGPEQQKQQERGDNRNGYEGVRNVQGRSFSAFRLLKEWKHFTVTEAHHRRFTLMSADQEPSRESYFSRYAPNRASGWVRQGELRAPAAERSAHKLASSFSASIDSC